MAGKYLINLPKASLQKKEPTFVRS